MNTTTSTGTGPLLTVAQQQMNQQGMSQLGALGNVYSPYIGTSAAGWPVDPAICGNYRIEKCDNGYIVFYARAQGYPEMRHFSEDLKQAGEFITATCVKHELEGRKT